MRSALIFACLIAVAGCSCPPPQADDVAGFITDISFMAQHLEKHCSKGCSYNTVPDTWFVRVWDKNGDNSVLSMTHGPWKWQYEGAPILVHWRTYCSFGGRSWRVDSYDAALGS